MKNVLNLVGVGFFRRKSIHLARSFIASAMTANATPARHLLLVVGVLLLAIPVSAANRSQTDRKAAPPNVLFIIADDLNDIVGFMGGHPQARTPNIDRLARRGVTFSKAYSNCPLCHPSRVSLWTGIAPWHSNIYGNVNAPAWRSNQALKGAVTMQEHFKANGYNVYGTGKVFHVYASETLPGIWTDYGNRIGFYPTPGSGGANNPRTGHPSMPAPLDKDLWLSCGPLSDVPNVPPDPQTGRPGYKGWTMGGGKPFRYVDDIDRDPMPDEMSATYIVDLLGRVHDKPFLAVCGFFRPHEPLYVPKKYFDLFPIEEVILPATIKDDLKDVPQILWDSPSAHQSEFKHQRFLKVIAAGKGPAVWKRWVQAYLACVAFIDDQVGTILDALDSSAYADNTIVVFTSDHGYNMGEKETLFKYTLWEKSARVPLIVATPQMRRQHPLDCRTPVSLIDVYPTLIDLCGLPANPNKNSKGKTLDGYSFRALLENPASNQWLGPAAAVTVMADNDPEGPLDRQHISIRSERWRYTLCSNGEEELYDHLYDPNEWTNLAADKKYASIMSQHHQYVRELLRSARNYNGNN